MSQNTIITPLDVSGEAVTFDDTATYQLFLLGQDILIRIPWIKAGLVVAAHTYDGITFRVDPAVRRGVRATRVRDGKQYPSSHVMFLNRNNAADIDLDINFGYRDQMETLTFIHIRSTTTEHAHALHGRINDALFKILKNIHLSRKQDSTAAHPPA